MVLSQAAATCSCYKPYHDRSLSSVLQGGMLLSRPMPTASSRHRELNSKVFVKFVKLTTMIRMMRPDRLKVGAKPLCRVSLNPIDSYRPVCTRLATSSAIRQPQRALHAASLRLFSSPHPGATPSARPLLQNIRFEPALPRALHERGTSRATRAFATTSDPPATGSSQPSSSFKPVSISIEKYHELADGYLELLVEQLEAQLLEGRKDVDVEWSVLLSQFRYTIMKRTDIGHRPAYLRSSSHQPVPTFSTNSRQTARSGCHLPFRAQSAMTGRRLAGGTHATAAR